MKKVLFPILALVLALGLTLPTAAPAAAHTEDDPQTRELRAGQNIVVGTVSVWNDGDYLYVKYQMTTGDWQIVETHLAVATSPEGIPQTKKGNPKVGKFNYQAQHDPWVTEYTYEIEGLGEPMYYIAAHAVVANVQTVQTMTVVSDTTDLWWSGATGDDIDTGYYILPRSSEAVWSPAASCWVHPSWYGGLKPLDLRGALFATPGADWIWGPVAPPDNTVTLNASYTGDIIFFKKQIDIPDDAIITQARLLITTDNGYYFYINDDWSGTPVGEDGFPSGFGPTNFYYVADGSHQSGGRNSVTYETIDNVYPLEAGVSTEQKYWSGIESYDIGPYLHTGQNWLQIVAINEHADPRLPKNNPGGLIYKAEITYLEEETAWAYGDSFTNRGSWATYFTYEIQ